MFFLQILRCKLAYVILFHFKLIYLLTNTVSIYVICNACKLKQQITSPSLFYSVFR